jgi:hypothetical protein
MNKESWKEARKYYSRRKILRILIINVYLRNFKWYLFHLWYKVSKYDHNHIWNKNVKCLICRKWKRDVDQEKLDDEKKELIEIIMKEFGIGENVLKNKSIEELNLYHTHLRRFI